MVYHVDIASINWMCFSFAYTYNILIVGQESRLNIQDHKRNIGRNGYSKLILIHVN